MAYSDHGLQRLMSKATVCLLCLLCSTLLCPGIASPRYRDGGGGGGGGKKGRNESREVHVQLTHLKLVDFSHRGSLHVDRIELRSEERDRNAFYVHNPTDPNYPLWAAARASVADVWPRPRREERSRRRGQQRRRGRGRSGGVRVFSLGSRLRIRLVGGAELDDVIRLAVGRFAGRAFESVAAVSDEEVDEVVGSAVIGSLEVSVRNASFQRYPHLEMREDYEVTVDASGIRLVAQENWGVLRGLETIAQLIFVSRREPNKFLIHENHIVDSPAYKYRGLMIDTARHFIHKTTLFENLEAMSMNKMNVFHWHIVDDQSFPYLSQKFPQLAFKSAYAGGKYYYTAEDIREVVEFARHRGIRVVPEFDTPDHTHSWGHALPDLVSWCSVGNLAYTGPLDPTRPATFQFLAEFYTEVAELFPDAWLHLGMDEVSVDCWRMNATIGNFMREKRLASYEQLIAYYANRLSGIIENLPIKKKVMVWEDILGKDSAQHPLKLPQDAIVQVWITRDTNKLAEWSKRYRIIRSEDWYLDQRGYGADWVKRYRFQLGPLDLGGEACMWTEFQSDASISERIWPSASAVAERLWSGDIARDPALAAPRIEEQNCRMLARGIRVGVAGGPGMCQKPLVARPPSWLLGGNSGGGGGVGGHGAAEFPEHSAEMLVNVSSNGGDNCWLYKLIIIVLVVGYLLRKIIRCPAAAQQAAPHQFCYLWRRLPLPTISGLRSLTRHEQLLCYLLILYCLAWVIVQL